MSINKATDLRKKLGMNLAPQAQVSMARRFAKMQQELDKLTKRVRRLEGTDSPDAGDSP